MAKRGRPPHPDVLTPREWEVLALVREGLTNDAIAERLGITERTAKYHVSEILGKLGLSSRQEAARWQPGQRSWPALVLAPAQLIGRKAAALLLRTGGLAATGVVAVGVVGLAVAGLLVVRQTRAGPTP